MSTTSKSFTRSLLSRLPGVVRRPIENLMMLQNMGAFSDLSALSDQVRHHDEYLRFERGMRDHFVMATVLRAHDLGAFDAILAGAATPAKLAAECNIQANAAEAMLRILEGQGYAVRQAERFELSPFGVAFLTRSGSCTLAPMMDLMLAQASAFNEILEGMNTGAVPEPLNISTPDSNYLAYLHAVNAYLHKSAADFIAKARLPPIQSIIAGSMGVSTVAHLLTRFPDARVTFGCLPHLVKEIPELCGQYGVDTRSIEEMHDHAGDPEQDAWGGQSFDLVLLTKKMILEPHNNLGERFARKAFEVLRPGGVAVFWETIYPDHKPLPKTGALEAVLNMGPSPAAAVHTERSFKALLESMGYSDIQTISCLFGQTSFVVAARA